jgi:medium-chain acyl-[acyl-carrier-protein] hydrolase
MTTMSAESSEAWVKRFRPPAEARLNLFCFPYAGGGASVFRTWCEGLPPDVETFALQLPGREGRLFETPLDDLSSLIDVLADVLVPYLERRPSVFYGHSMGALLGYELARRLRRQGRSLPRHLIVSGRQAPHLPEHRTPLHPLPDREFLTGVGRFNGTPRAVLENAELMELILPTLRADFTVCETYVYRREDPLGCSLSAYGGLRDDQTRPDEIAAWQEHTLGAFTQRMFPGDHFFPFNETHLFLGTLSAELSQLNV